MLYKCEGLLYFVLLRELPTFMVGDASGKAGIGWAEVFEVVSLAVARLEPSDAVVW